MKRPALTMFTGLAIVAVLALGAPAARSQSESSAERTIDTANALLGRGLYDLAQEEYEAFLRSYSTHPEADVARYALGVCHARQGAYAEAVRALDALRGGEGFEYGAEAALTRADALAHLGRHAEAAGALRAMLEAWPEHPGAPSAGALLVESLARAGKPGESVECAEWFVERWPGDGGRARVELFQAMALAALGRDSEAARMAGALVTRTDDPALIQSARLIEAQGLHASGELEGASRAYRDVLESCREDLDDLGRRGDALLGLGQVERVRGNRADARRSLETFLECCATEAGARDAARLELTIVRFEAREFAEAAALGAALAEDGGATFRDDGAYWRARALMRLGRDAEASRCLEAALRDAPASELAPRMLYDLGVASRRSGDREGAVRSFALFTRTFPQHELGAFALHAQAALALEGGAPEEARRLAQRFERAHAGHELATDVRLIAGEAAYIEGDYADAAEAFGAVSDAGVGADVHRAWYRLGMSQFRMGRPDEARRTLERVVGEGATEAYRPALAALGDMAFDAGAWSDAERWLGAYLDGAPADDEGAPAAALKLGLALARQDRNAEAIVVFDAALGGRGDADIIEQATFERGQCLMAMGRTEEAEAAFRALIEAGPRSRFAAYAMRHVGTLSLGRGDAEEASKWFAGAAGRGGDGAESADVAREARYDRARALLQAGDARGALRELDGLLRSESLGHELRARGEAARALALARTGQHEAAIGVIEGLDVATLDAHTRRALAYERAAALRSLGRTEAADRAFEALSSPGATDNLSRHAMLERAAIAMEAGRFERGASLLDDLLGEGDDLAELREPALYRRGVCAHELGDPEGVIAALEGFHEGYPESPVGASADLLCGEAMVELVRRRDALAYLERASASDAPSDVRASALLRLVALRGDLQEWEASREAGEVFLDAFPESDQWFRARFGVGWALENEGRHEEAMASYREVVERHEGETAARAQFQIGECLFAMGRHDEAVRELLRVEILYAYPSWSAAALFEAGRCFEAMSRIGEARAQYRRVTEEFADTTWAPAAKERLTRLAGGPMPGRE